jgi:hypothetical protein
MCAPIPAAHPWRFCFAASLFFAYQKARSLSNDASFFPIEGQASEDCTPTVSELVEPFKNKRSKVIFLARIHGFP